jgi:hypothetical protein
MIKQKLKSLRIYISIYKMNEQKKENTLGNFLRRKNEEVRNSLQFSPISTRSFRGDLNPLFGGSNTFAPGNPDFDRRFGRYIGPIPTQYSEIPKKRFDQFGPLEIVNLNGNPNVDLD